MKIRIGEVGVDAGMVMVGDPCYFVGKDATVNKRCKTWQQACKEVFCKEVFCKDTPMNVYGLGVAVGTTHGDGCYPVYLQTTKAGRRRLVVNLD